MQIQIPATRTEDERWVEVPPLITRSRLLMDTHTTVLATVAGTNCLQLYS